MEIGYSSRMRRKGIAEDAIISVVINGYLTGKKLKRVKRILREGGEEEAGLEREIGYITLREAD